MSGPHIVAIYLTEHMRYEVMFSDGVRSGRNGSEALQMITSHNQHVDRLPEVGECILVDPPERPPADDLWFAEQGDGSWVRFQDRIAAASAALRPDCTGRIWHIWRDDGKLVEHWERVK